MAHPRHGHVHCHLQHPKVLRDHDHCRPRHEPHRHRGHRDEAESDLHVILPGLEQADPHGARPVLHDPDP